MCCAGIVEVVEILIVLGCSEDAGGSGDVFGADRFAVPTCALGVDFVVVLLVGFGGPFETCRQCFFVDFVVVVDEFLAPLDGVGEVGLG